MVVVLLLLVSSMLAPGEARAINWVIKNNETHGKWNLTPTASVTPWYFSPGLRLGIPIAKSGFIPSRNDEVKLEIGINFQIWWRPVWRSPECHPWCTRGHPEYDPGRCRDCRHDYAGPTFFRLGLPAMLRWQFYLTKVWSVYAIFGMEFGIPFDPYYRDAFGPDDWVWIVLGVGTCLQVKEWFAFRFELGTIGLPVFGFEFLLG
jgi:hypothetical protein